MIAIYIICGLILFYLIISFFAMKFAIGRTKRKQNFDKEPFVKYKDVIIAGSKWANETKYEEVTITSFDGVKLYARFYNQDSKKTIILFHGYHSSGVTDFSGICAKYYALGFNLLMVDQRAHNKSGGKYIGFGVLERYDCQEWCKYISSRIQDSKIVLGGMSMGASTVMMASALPIQNLVGIIADCGYTSPRKIVEFRVKGMKLKPWMIVPAMNLMAKIFAKYSFNSLTTIEALEKCAVPMLIIHGKKDSIVPFEMGIENHKACKTSKLFSVENANHGACYLEDKKACEEVLFEFLNSITK